MEISLLEPFGADSEEVSDVIGGTEFEIGHDSFDS